jgi:hypothetical protein
VRASDASSRWTSRRPGARERRAQALLAVRQAVRPRAHGRAATLDGDETGDDGLAEPHAHRPPRVQLQSTTPKRSPASGPAIIRPRAKSWTDGSRQWVNWQPTARVSATAISMYVHRGRGGRPLGHSLGQRGHIEPNEPDRKPRRPPILPLFAGLSPSAAPETPCFTRDRTVVRNHPHPSQKRRITRHFAAKTEAAALPGWGHKSRLFETSSAQTSR